MKESELNQETEVKKTRFSDEELEEFRPLF